MTHFWGKTNNSGEILSKSVLFTFCLIVALFEKNEFEISSFIHFSGCFKSLLYHSKIISKKRFN